MNFKSAILQTLRYSDFFDYPLNLDEIWSYLIVDKPVSKFSLKQQLSKMVGEELSFASPFYCLKGREKIFSLRNKRFIISARKLELSEPMISFLRFIPSVELIGISGSLARMNTDEEADIDLFIITAANTLWITRLLVLICLQIFGKRRSRKDKKASDKICVNFFMDTENLAFAKNRQDVFTAYEIAQMKIIFVRDNIYTKFIQSNLWIFKILANWSPYSDALYLKSSAWQISYLRFFEPLSRGLQIWNVHRHLTTEIVGKGIAAFHPYDYHILVMSSLKSTDTYGTLTKG
ncbi:MAG TPA: hypothetical protein VMR41_01225 [Patescibacteria group bacterium]|nr:hypothetical protein [Patescibacteria group bacterium]